MGPRVYDVYVLAHHHPMVMTLFIISRYIIFYVSAHLYSMYDPERVSATGLGYAVRWDNAAPSPG